VPARVTSQERAAWRVVTADGDLVADLAGRVRHHARSAADLPVPGDWVQVVPRPTEGRATIVAVHERTSCLSRKAAGATSDAQVVAANIDVVMVVTALGPDLSLRRIERWLALAWESGAAPALVLSKSDLAGGDGPEVAERVLALAPGVPVVLASGVTGEGLDLLRALVPPGRTAVLVGSSGTGKSTLVNALLGRDVQPTAPVRASDGTGQHTTTRRDLLALPGGGVLIDTPGVREVGLVGDDDEGLGATFGEVDTLAARCRFNDCAHETEPGCAVRAAVESGALELERLESWHHLQRELAFARRKTDALARKEAQRQWKVVSKSTELRMKLKGRLE
jgi:ribosome biogenesis GTPase